MSCGSGCAASRRGHGEPHVGRSDKGASQPNLRLRCKHVAGIFAIPVGRRSGGPCDRPAGTYRSRGPSACRTISVTFSHGDATSYQPIERRKVYDADREQLLAQIGSRRLRPGDPLPPERELTRDVPGRALLDPRGAAHARVAGRDRARERRHVRRRRPRRTRSNSSLRLLVHARRAGGHARPLRAAPDPRVRGCGARGGAASRRAPRRDGRRDRGDGSVARRRPVAATASSTPTSASTSRSPRRPGTGSCCTACTPCATSLRRALVTVYTHPAEPRERRRRAPRDPRGDRRRRRRPGPRRRCARTSAASRATSRRESCMAELGYVGLGVMGGGDRPPPARRRPRRVTVWNRTREKAEPLARRRRALGGQPARGRRAQRDRLHDGHEHGGGARP